MARRLRVEWRKGRKVGARLSMPPRARGPAVLLAHGAGAGQVSWFISTIRDGLAEAGFPSMSFDYPYIEEGRKRPDHPSILQEAHLAAAHRLADYADRIVLGGKSMGGRIGGHVAREAGAAGLVFFGYPFVAIGSGEVRSIDHLIGLAIPQLFVSGSRDSMGPLPTLRAAVSAIHTAEAAIIEGGDHSLKVAKSAGLSYEEVLDGVIRITSDWLEGI